MKSKDEKAFIRVISETIADDGFVDCVWEMPTWFANKLEAEAKKRKITVSDLVTLIFKAVLKEYASDELVKKLDN